MQNLRKLGGEKEELAVSYLKNQGYIILDRNVYTRDAEADVIAMDGEVLCFIEVKYRRNNKFGTAEEAITPSKIKKIIKAARVYLLKHPKYNNYEIRFDVVAINGDEIRLIKAAFET